MDLITQQALDHLLNSHSEWSMSLFMPAHRAGRETQKDPIRFKNLLNKAEGQLEERGCRTPDIKNILKPARDLIEDFEFWQHQSDGLAVFASPEAFEVYRLPIRFEELVVISNHFHIKPLLPLFTNDGHFYILALSQNEVRLLEGTQYTVDEVDMEKNLPNLAETLKFDLFSKQLQFHTGTARETDSGETAAMFFGHDPSDKEEKRLLQWFHKVDDVLGEVITNRQSPIVLAGVEYLFPLFKKTSSFNNIMAKGVEGNPDDLSAEELHTKAWPLIKPYFMETQNEAFSRYKDLSNTDQVTTNLEKTFLAAYQGRIELVFTVEDYQVWGNYDVDTNKVHIHNEFQAGDEDLLNLVSIYTLKNGGTVFVVDEGTMPAKAPQAAILRF
ncbi:MAG: hypothetical protein CL609_09925 [Anaerolineaceae bacterium]|nr:hypothetical protein [Anaerolineaceae bacterium]